MENRHQCPHSPVKPAIGCGKWMKGIESHRLKTEARIMAQGSTYSMFAK